RFAGRRADGLITSVKDPVDTIERVIGPFNESSTKHGNAGTVLATRWTVFAEDADDAWRALGSMRGLRAPGRLEAVDPMVLRQRADEMDRSQILGKYTIVGDTQGLIDAYLPLVHDVGADYVSVQVATTHVDQLMDMMEHEVLPELRKAATD
ncbi:MAG: LLM class F420-dependent oxidoreductase, partial [Acidimicrobiia bacterium]|nr:LLM class F420-dependent oxidoreductase [Acidimicrobiia bacterium]